MSWGAFEADAKPYFSSNVRFVLVCRVEALPPPPACTRRVKNKCAAAAACKPKHHSNTLGRDGALLHLNATLNTHDDLDSV